MDAPAVMSTQQGTDIETLFAAAREVAPDERDAFLAERCADDERRAAVSALLAAYEDAGSFFDELRAHVSAPAVGEAYPSGSAEAGASPWGRASDPLGLVGTSVGGYAVQEHIGGGGMGLVYRAWDPRLERSVALKFLPPFLAMAPPAQERFETEARTAARLEHPNVATIHEIGETEQGRRFIVMTHYDGETLRQQVTREGPLAPGRAATYVQTLAEALHQVHRAGIVHRDVKPANVMITAQGTLKLLDFGLAKAVTTGLSLSGRRLGTPSYMSPEQADGAETGPQTDVWALGVILYELLTGERPFTGERPPDVLAAVRGEEPIPVRSRRSAVPRALASIVTRCLAKDPEKRYASAEALTAALRALEADQGADAARAMAVLPFASTGPEDAGALTEGMHESILARLSNVADLKVTVGAAADRRGDEALAAVASDLGVRWLLTGRVWRADDRIQITVRLVDAQTDATAWADTYRRDLTAENVFDVQEQITRKITEALTAEVTAGERERIAGTPTQNLTAYRLYVQGRSALGRRDREGVAAAVTHFRRAVEEDPGYALAWSGLADALALRPIYAPESTDAQTVEPADAARRALERAPDLAEGHASLGYLKGPPAGVRHLRHAIDLKPSYAQARQWLAHELLVTGAREVARVHTDFGADLAPHSRATQGFVAFVDVAEGAYPSALKRLGELVDPGREGEPEWVLEMGARYQFGALYGLERWDQAQALADRRSAGTDRAKWQTEWAAKRGMVDEARGDTEAAHRRLDRLGTGAGSFFRGLLHAALDEQEAAFAAFEAVETWSYTDVVELRYFYPSLLDPLRREARFDALLDTVDQRRAPNPTAAYRAHAG